MRLSKKKKSFFWGGKWVGPVFGRRAILLFIDRNTGTIVGVLFLDVPSHPEAPNACEGADRARVLPAFNIGSVYDCSPRHADDLPFETNQPPA